MRSERWTFVPAVVRGYAVFFAQRFGDDSNCSASTLRPCPIVIIPDEVALVAATEL